MDNEGNEPAKIGVLAIPIVLEEWPGPWAAWARSYCYRNLWRVTSILGNDLEEAVSECALVYVQCKLRYGATAASPAAFMALYKLCVTSRFNDLSVKDSKLRTCIEDLVPLTPVVHIKADSHDDRGKYEPLHDIAIAPEGEYAVKLSEASDELKEVLSIFFSAPQEVMDTLRGEAKSCCPKEFFKHVVTHLGLRPTQMQPLARELKGLMA
jgi:hypothetical protein